MLKVTMTLILLGIVPMVLGIPWTSSIKVRFPLFFSYGIGFFSELALFHVVTFPFAFFHGHFHSLIIVFSILLSIICLTSLIYICRVGLLKQWKTIKLWKRLYWHEWVLLCAFFLLVAYQIYHGFATDLTYMSYDDAAYIPTATDALSADSIGMINFYTGVASTMDIQRIIKTSLYFPAYLSATSGISVTTMEHTVQYIQLLSLAYIIYIYVAGELFEKRDNRLAFLVFVSVFYIFGYHSHYSLTFRLLGPNYQGKAVLAVSLTPLILAILINALKESYRWQIGALLFVLSLAAVSLTLWGTGTICVIVSMPVVLSMFRKNRNWKHLLYIPWSLIAPALFVGVYSLYAFSM